MEAAEVDGLNEAIEFSDTAWEGVPESAVFIIQFSSDSDEPAKPVAVWDFGFFLKRNFSGLVPKRINYCFNL